MENREGREEGPRGSSKSMSSLSNRNSEGWSGCLLKREEVLRAELSGPYLSYTKYPKGGRTLNLSGSTVEFDDDSKSFSVSKTGTPLKGETFMKLFRVESDVEYYTWKAALCRALLLWSPEGQDQPIIRDKLASDLTQLLSAALRRELLFSFLTSLVLFDVEAVHKVMEKEEKIHIKNETVEVEERNVSLSKTLLLEELNSTVVVLLVSLPLTVFRVLDTFSGTLFEVYETPLKLRLDYTKHLHEIRKNVVDMCQVFAHNILLTNRNVLCMEDATGREISLREALQYYQSFSPKAPWFPLNAFLQYRVRSILRHTLVLSHPSGNIPGLLGAENIGNTCYLNSVLQCLLHTPVVARFFATQSLALFEEEEKDTAVAEAFQELVRRAWRKDKKLNPEDLLKATQHRVGKRSFRKGDQHDANEMFIALLTQLESDLKTTLYPYFSTDSPSTLPSHTTHHDADRLTFEWWKAFVNQQCSFLTHIFYGQLVQKIHCKACSRSSYSCESFNFLFIPLSISDQSLVTIEDCFKHYFRQETVKMSWKCDLCNATTEDPRKSLGLHRLPPYLVVCVNRFRKNEKGVFIDKSDVHLKFGSKLYLGPWMTESTVFPGVGEDGALYLSDGDLPPSKRGKYYLYACVCHSGVVDRGHYYTHCRVGDGWWHFNDSHVRRDSHSPWGSDTVGKEVYMLFYVSSAGMTELHF